MLLKSFIVTSLNSALCAKVHATEVGDTKESQHAL